MRTSGGKGWLGLVAYVILWDKYADETLSNWFWDSLRHPTRRVLVAVVWGLITVHLFRNVLRLNPKYDPLEYVR